MRIHYFRIFLFMLLVPLMIQTSYTQSTISPKDDATVTSSCFKIPEIRPPAPEASAPRVYIKNGDYEIFESRFHTYGYKIRGGTGGLEATGGLPGGTRVNAVYVFVGKTTLILPNDQSFVFEGDPSNPLTFVLLQDMGLVYMEGIGQVSLADGKTMKLPCARKEGDRTPANSTVAASAGDTSRVGNDQETLSNSETTRLAADRPASPARSDILELQQLLYELGLNPGPCDGVWGTHTEEAVAHFQRLYGLQVARSLDEATQARVKAMRGSLVPEAAAIIRDPGKAFVSGTVHVRGDTADCRAFTFEDDILLESGDEGIAYDRMEPFHLFRGVVHVYHANVCLPDSGTPFTAKVGTEVNAAAGGSMGIKDGRLVSTGPLTVRGSVAMQVESGAPVFEVRVYGSDSLTLVLTRKGFRYMSGVGRITVPSGKTYSFGGAAKPE